jgi:hypothetical protein
VLFLTFIARFMKAVSRLKAFIMETHCDLCHHEGQCRFKEFGPDIQRYACLFYFLQYEYEICKRCQFNADACPHRNAPQEFRKSVCQVYLSQLLKEDSFAEVSEAYPIFSN